MKNIILKSCLIALCLICGLGSAWGETATLTFTAACGGSGTDSQGNTWTVTSDADESTYDGTKGIHYGTGKKAVSHLTLTCSKISGTITKIVVNASGASGTSATLKATVGGTDFGTQNQSLTSSNVAYTFSGSASGDIVITASQPSATKALYVKSIEVTYSSGTTKTLSSIAVRNAPAKTTYTEGENFDPAGLVITATYSDSDPEDIAYSGNESDFSFSPTLTTALTTSNTSVTITYGGKSTAQSITVNEKPKHTAHFSINGTINDAYDCTVTEGSVITFPTGLADINGKKFVGWMEGTISGTADKAPDFVTSATMGTADITYNAVYATQTGSGEAQTTLVNSTDGLVAGNTYYIAASATYAGTTVVMGKNTGGNNFPATAFSAEPLALTLGGNATDGWTFSYTDGGSTYYLDPTNTTGSNYLKRNTSVTEYGKFSISFSSDAAVITSKGKTSRNILRYNGTNNPPMFSCYSSGQSPVYLFTESGGTTYSGYCTTVPTSGPTDASWAVTPDAVSVEVGKTATATISTDYDGTLSVSSNATGTATATISGKTITVTGVAAGTTTLTVTGAATSNFNAISKTIGVTVTASSATTPAFAYFEETATINVGEILEAKDYCGTIAPDAGFDEYSISTAVCSAIGAADGQKISDDYACIYSKVSFKKAGTYVVHVTAPAVAGKYTASEGYITVTVTGPTLYKVTIETPENGTLIVKHGDDIVESGDEFEEGEKLQITATPDADYKFRNWQAYDGTTHTFTTSFEWEMSAHDVTLTANFDEIQDYTIAWSVNGQIVKSETLEEGTEVVPVLSTDDLFTAAVPAGVTKVFTGWVTTPTVDAEATPSYVTPAATATKDVTYYAVFAHQEGGSGSSTESTSISAFEEGDYYIIDVYENRYYAITGGINSKRLTATDVTESVTLNTNGSITLDSQHLTTDMIYHLAQSSEYYTLTHAEDNISPSSSGNDLVAAADNKWSGFEANTPNTGRYSLTGSYTSKDKTTNCCLLIQTTSWNGTEQAPTLYVKAYAQSNREVVTPKAQCYASGYMWWVPATTGSTTYSDFTTLPYLQLNEANTSIVELADAPCDKVEVTRALKAGNWNTFCLPFSLNEEEIESQLGSDAEVKALSTFDVNDEGTTLILNFGDASEIAAGQPYMVRVQEAVSTIIAEGKTINTVTAPVQEFSNDLYNCNFHGNYYYLEGTKNGYVPHSTFIISNNLFYLVNSNVKMKGFRGYIEATEKATGAPVKAMSFTTDAVVTGTIGIQYEGLEDGCIYNLQGLRQSKLQKGINIVNGKKVLR